MTRVAFVLGTASGGTARHVGTLAEGCIAAGLAVRVLGPPETLARVQTSADTAVIKIGDRPYLRALRALRVELAARPADVVHAHGVRAGALTALAIASMHRSVRPALVITVHNAPPDRGPARLGYYVLERICARRADLVLCASADLLARMPNAEQFDVPAPRRPAPTPAAAAAARTAIDAHGRPVVLAVARLARQKGLDVLIDAAADWRDREPPPVTVIAGDGPLAAELRTQATETGVDLALLGARDDVPALLAVADVVVVPSRWEARALAIQEAMRSGRPIVATRVGGTPALTGADAALLVPPGDARALGRAVLAVLDDEALADRLGRAALARSAALPSEDDAVKAALAIYTRLAAPHKLG